jgi:hypothetical protein
MKAVTKSLAFLAAAAVIWLAAGSAAAQRHDWMLSERGYDEMRRLAQRLDATAQHAADQARHQDSWVYRHNSRFVQAVSDFARRADRFKERMANYRAAPWNVDDEIRNLTRSAQNVQSIARASREADEHTVADWNDAVLVLNRMTRLYDADVRRTARYDWSTPLPEYRAEGQRDAYGEYGREQGNYDRRGNYDRLASLARELNDRATRAHQMAEDAAGNPQWRAHREYFDRIHHFNDQAREFDRLVSSRQADTRVLREQARRLLDDARQADGDMRQNNVLPQVWEEWRGAMQVLERIVNTLGA